MIGKIDKDGFFLIRRGNRFKNQYCPFNQNGHSACGDWCSLFGEPEEKVFCVSEGKKELLNLCHGRQIIFDEFCDKRRKRGPG